MDTAVRTGKRYFISIHIVIRFLNHFIMFYISQYLFRNYTQNENIKIFHGIEDVINTELQFFSNADNRIDTCMNYTRPQLAVVLDPIRNAFVDAKNRGVRLRYLTEITTENISYCKDLLPTVSQLRHLGGIKGNFMISESEYLAPAVSFEKGKVATRIIYSNVKELVEEHEYVFDTLWSKAISAEQRIREIEEDIEPIRTRLLENQDVIIREIKRQNNRANKLSICTAIGGMQMSYNYLFDSYRTVVDKHRKGESKEGLRWLTNIVDKESANLFELLVQSGMQVRHIKNMPPLNFGVSDKEVALTVEKMEGGKMSSSFLISSEPLYVEHFNNLFDKLWKNGIDAQQRVKDIEQGAETSDIEIITNPKESIGRSWDLIRSANREVLIMVSTANAFRRQLKMGVMNLFKEVSKEGAVKIRMLIPAASDEQTMHTINELSLMYPQQIVDFRIADESLRFRITIMLIDKKDCLITETKDDFAENSYDAMGLTTYSNSKSIVLSYVSIFEGLWKQSELYEQLKVHNKMQKEFINVAAHELRTPIQPILGLSAVLRSKTKDTDQHELLDAIIRNAKRLQRLTENILDVTRIESHSLELNKERFSLNEIIRNVINDVNNQAGFRINNNNKTVSILFEPKQDVFVEADKVRIYEVISNLLKNAIQFTKEGTITIAAEEEEKMNSNEAIVSVKDTGTGIDPEIFPRLFTKFVSKSVAGTGLGLFISKSIVEAHGGKMWGENNADGRGATFYFNLPLSK
jgi:two-component system, OmpR family, sensor histidine kinase VicK